uniref:Dihydroorotate dehydrogenase B (NAD(+)), catalytic subunit n=1 Tax=Zeugodacus cucurbitae TaxID=28588 RepID=A0A0A1WSZ0_ZEUCU
MGNLYSKVWSSKKKNSKLYMKPLPNDASVLNAVEDIQTITPEQVEQQFEDVCCASHKVLYSLTYNPCGQLSMRIRQCLDENVLQMSKCFAEMDEYRKCVSDMMAQKLAGVVIDKQDGDKFNESDLDVETKNRPSGRKQENDSSSCA